MKKLILIAVACAAGMSLNVEAADLATVNGVAIKQSTLDFIIKEAASKGKKVDASVSASIVDQLITTELIDQEARKSDLTKQADFQIKEQLTLQELRVHAFIDDYVQHHPIDDQSLHAEYDRLKAQAHSQEYKASHILVKTEEEAKRVIAALDTGVDFSQLAKEMSLDSSKDNGGDLGWLTPDAVVPPFADALTKLRKGSYTTAPIQTEFGWHVIKLEDTRDVPPPAFDAVKAQILNNLQGQQLEKFIADLRSKAKIVNTTLTK